MGKETWMFGCLVLTLGALMVGATMCAQFMGWDPEAEEAELQALARQKRRAWMHEARANAQVSIDKVTRNYKTGFVDIDYTVTNAGTRTFCFVRTGISTRGYKDQVRGGSMFFDECLAPGYSAQAKGKVRGYTVTSHAVHDVKYRDDCRNRTSWDSLKTNRECAQTHGYKFHGPAAY